MLLKNIESILDYMCTFMYVIQMDNPVFYFLRNLFGEFK